jgi:hypothetical protein
MVVRADLCVTSASISAPISGDDGVNGDRREHISSASATPTFANLWFELGA